MEIMLGKRILPEIENNQFSLRKECITLKFENNEPVEPHMSMKKYTSHSSVMYVLILFCLGSNEKLPCQETPFLVYCFYLNLYTHTF